MARRKFPGEDAYAHPYRSAYRQGYRAAELGEPRESPFTDPRYTLREAASAAFAAGYEACVAAGEFGRGEPVVPRSRADHYAERLAAKFAGALGVSAAELTRGVATDAERGDSRAGRGSRRRAS